MKIQINAPVSEYREITNSSGAISETEIVHVGDIGTDRDTEGEYSALFAINLDNFLKKGIGEITSINFMIPVSRNTNGYNGCYAKIEYIGSDYQTIEPQWQVNGVEATSFYLIESTSSSTPKENFFEISKVNGDKDIETLKNFENLIRNAQEGVYYYFRIQKHAGEKIKNNTGVEIEETITLTITFEETNMYIYDGSNWNLVIPYIYQDQNWKQTIPYFYNNNQWN